MSQRRKNRKTEEGLGFGLGWLGWVGFALLVCWVWFGLVCLCVCVCVCVCLCACPRYGIKQKRVVAVDGVAKELYNFDRHLRVRKKLPLEQLVQVLGVWCYR